FKPKVQNKIPFLKPKVQNNLPFLKKRFKTKRHQTLEPILLIQFSFLSWFGKIDYNKIPVSNI
ncbi:hypothetical protein, partial [Sphingobacterium sp. UBA6645]|uniref:hypothetical protein n=1 Tax=Sphingobacterium sp. UBA6645 TaxID=1947511 RepID=UPI0025D1F28A